MDLSFLNKLKTLSIGFNSVIKKHNEIDKMISELEFYSSRKHVEKIIESIECKVVFSRLSIKDLIQEEIDLAKYEFEKKLWNGKE